MNTLVRKKFNAQDIVIDGKTVYVNCTFTKCHFYYSGGDFQFINCQLQEPTVTFTGEAGKTFAFMQMVGMINQAQPPQPPPAVAQMPDAGGVH